MGRRVTVGALTVVFSWLMVAGLASAETLEDFEVAAKAAKEKKGAECVPYKKERVEIMTVHKALKEMQLKRRPDLDLIEKQKNNIINDIRKGRERIEDFRRQIEARRRAHKEAPVTDLNERIEKEEKEIKAGLEKLKEINEKNDLEKHRDEFERMHQMRVAIREMFQKVEEDVKKAKQNPASVLGPKAGDKLEQELRRFTQEILEYINEEKPEHKRQEDGYKDTEKRYKQIIEMAP